MAGDLGSMPRSGVELAAAAEDFQEAFLLAKIPSLGHQRPLQGLCRDPAECFRALQSVEVERPGPGAGSFGGGLRQPQAQEGLPEDGVGFPPGGI